MAQLNPAHHGEEYDLNDFDLRVRSDQPAGLQCADTLSTVQVNIGLTCNLICRHCHVNSSPRRKEQMDWETMEAVLRAAKELDARTIDITGGAPEMNPRFRKFVAEAGNIVDEVIVRTNLTVLLLKGYQDLPKFFRDQKVHLVASLPCYQEENVDAQRGEGVYQDSVKVIRTLNSLGYGTDPELVLTLVYNPGDSTLPPAQDALEKEYRRELKRRFDIDFTSLHTITNIPIGRFRGDLQRKHKLHTYLETLRNAYNSKTVESLMCRHQVSVGWDGSLYDCDFNLALRWPAATGTERNIRTADTADLAGRHIVTGDHCFACTAGAGSSCGGTLV